MPVPAEHSADPAETWRSTDWPHLFHAYGDARDTRALLADLVDPHGPVTAAREHLASAIVHQGTVWPASAPALAVMLGVVDRDLAAGRFSDADLIDLAGTLAEAAEVRFVVVPPDPALSEVTRALIDQHLGEDADPEDVEAFLEDLFADGRLSDEVMTSAAWQVQRLAPAVLATLDGIAAARPALAEAVEYARTAWTEDRTSWADDPDAAGRTVGED